MDNRKLYGKLLLIFLTGTSVLANTTGVDSISTAQNATSPISFTTTVAPTTTATTTLTTTTPETTTTSADTTTTLATTRESSDADGQDELSDFIRKYNSQAVIVSHEDSHDYIVPTKPELEVNKAWLTINSTDGYDIEVWAQTEECYKCDLMLVAVINGYDITTILANTTHVTDLRVMRKNSNDFYEDICGFKKTFKENGDYWIFINYPEQGECTLKLANDPDIAELPILFVFLGFIGLVLVYVGGKKMFIFYRQTAAHKRDSMDVTSTNDQDGGDALHMNNSNADKDGNAADTNKAEPDNQNKRQRLRSLDTFRGLTLVLMIFVNYGGGEYWFFDHAAWNGVTVADLVFPWFVFIMGVSMNFSFRSMFRKGWSIPRVTWKIVWRAAKLFMIGFMLGTHFETADLGNVRVLGVLQRLALTYLITALIHYCCTRRSDSHQDRKWAIVRDLVLYIPEWVVNLIVLAIHLSLMFALPVPGCPTGYIGPGGISEGGNYTNCTGGATGYVDSLMLGYEHMYKHPTPQVVYQTSQPFDPEGFMATLNCVFLCFLGVQCGRIILLYQDHKQRLIRFLIWAVLLGALAALLTKCSRDDGWIPANKNLWSFSYTLITASFGYILLSGIYIITDIFGLWKGQPFIYPGMNSIVIYMCHHIFSSTFPVTFEVGRQHWKLLLRSVWGTACWVIVAYWLYIKKIFIAL